VPAYFIHRYLPLQGTLLTWKVFLEILGKALVPMLLILVEPNNGTTAVIMASLLALCLLMQVPMKFWALPVGSFMLAGVLFASQLPYIKARFNVYLHPELDLKGRGHQPYQAKIAAGSGGLLGRGPGNSLQKMSYLPEAQNDYIAAIYAEEFGYLGIVSLISFYLIFLVAGFSIAFHAPTSEGFYYGSSIVFLITLQAFLNLGVVSGLLPSTGLNLPLFSQGGSSLMAHMTAIGFLLSISKSRKVYA
jgi:cell division protein FtsW